MKPNVDVDWEEAWAFRAGQRVEINRSGVFDTIADYDPLMVPPVWLTQDPQPRYPHELRLLEAVTPSPHKLLSHPRSKLS